MQNRESRDIEKRLWWKEYYNSLRKVQRTRENIVCKTLGSELSEKDVTEEENEQETIKKENKQN